MVVPPLLKLRVPLTVYFNDTIEKDKDTNNEHWLYSQDSDTSRLLALSSGAT